jgi:hypothetical protein
MSNMTPFEIRLELLKMAKDLLTEEYYGKRERVVRDWEMKIESAQVQGQIVPDHPDLPTFPTENDIIAKAASLNGFVSQTTTPEIKTKKQNS